MAELRAPSLSRVAVLVEAAGVTLRGELVRHWAPSTVSKLLALLPMTGRATWYQDAFIYFPVPLQEGLEKARSSFAEGEMAFMPSGAALCIFAASAPSPRPANPVGRLLDSAKPLRALREGGPIAIRRGEG